jgi:hypothetical protein
MADHLGSGGATVHKNDIPVLNERGRQLTNQTLLFGIGMCSLDIFWLMCQPLVEDSAPVRALGTPSCSSHSRSRRTVASGSQHRFRSSIRTILWMPDTLDCSRR